MNKEIETIQTPSDALRVLLRHGTFYASAIELDQYDSIPAFAGDDWEAKVKLILAEKKWFERNLLEDVAENPGRLPRALESAERQITTALEDPV